MSHNSSDDPPKSIGGEEGERCLSEPTQKADANPSENPLVSNGFEGFIKTQDLTNSILRYLSTASNESLAACAVGLASITYILLGRVGLVIIGICGGVVLHATWEENVRNDTTDLSDASEARRRKEASLNVAERVLNWRNKKQWHNIQDRSEVQNIDSEISAQKELDFSGFQPATAAALGALTDAVIRDYVKYSSGLSIY